MTLNSIIALILHYFTEFDSFRGWLRHSVEDSDVTIIESKIKMEFFLKIELNQSIFWLVFFRFWLTAILAKTAHCCEFKAWQLSRGKECWIRRLNYTYTNRMSWRPRGVVATAASRCPLYHWPNLSSPLPICYGGGRPRAPDIYNFTSPSIIGLCAV